MENLEKLTKDELLNLLKSKVDELTTAYKGIREKDEKIATLQTRLNDLEAAHKVDLERLEQNLHNSYQKLVKEAEAVSASYKTIHGENQRLSTVVITYDELVEEFEKLNAAKDRTLQKVTSMLRNTFIERSKGG